MAQNRVVVTRLHGLAALAAQPLWESTLQRAIDDADGRWSMEQCTDHVIGELLDVWTVTNEKSLLGVFTTRVIESRERWILVEDLAGVSMEEWFDIASDVVEEWARSIGATQILAEGRRGWEKKMKQLGYTVRRIQGVKKLSKDILQ